MRAAPRFAQGTSRLSRPVLWIMAGLSLCAGVLGFATGQSVSDLSETDVISVYARVYARETGGDISDCAALPGRGAVWLTIRCVADDRSRLFLVGRDGWLITRNDDKSAHMLPASVSATES